MNFNWGPTVNVKGTVTPSKEADPVFMPTEVAFIVAVPDAESLRVTVPGETVAPEDDVDTETFFPTFPSITEVRLEIASGFPGVSALVVATVMVEVAGADFDCSGDAVAVRIANGITFASAEGETFETDWLQLLVPEGATLGSPEQPHQLKRASTLSLPVALPPSIMSLPGSLGLEPTVLLRIRLKFRIVPA